MVSTANLTSLNLIIKQKARDTKGRFISSPFSKNIQEQISLEIKNALVGEMLGDGCLRYTKKIINGKPNPNWNVVFAITLKSIEHIYYLWNIYSPICSNNPPRPWPNPNSKSVMNLNLIKDNNPNT